MVLRILLRLNSAAKARILKRFFWPVKQLKGSSSSNGKSPLTISQRTPSKPPRNQRQPNSRRYLIDILLGLQFLDQAVHVDLLIIGSCGERQFHLLGGIVELAL